MITAGRRVRAPADSVHPNTAPVRIGGIPTKWSHTMSAWLCSQDHINVLISFAIDNGVPADDPEGLCRVLTKENIRSLETRYPGRDFLQDWIDEAAEYKFEYIANIPELTRLLHKEKNEALEVRLGY